MISKRNIYNYIILILVFLAITLNVTNYISVFKTIVIFSLTILAIIITYYIKESKKFLNTFLDLLVFLVKSIVILLIISNFILFTSPVQGESMEPTISNNQRVFVNKLLINVKHNDIVVYRRVLEKDYIIKRVAALKGDIIELEETIINGVTVFYLKINGDIYINQYNEKYVVRSSYLLYDLIVTNGNVYTLKKEDILLLGDNQSHSVDSRQQGLYQYKNIVGKRIGKNQ